MHCIGSLYRGGPVSAGRRLLTARSRGRICSEGSSISPVAADDPLPIAAGESGYPLSVSLALGVMVCGGKVIRKGKSRG